jgi:hypothetical protein
MDQLGLITTLIVIFSIVYCVILLLKADKIHQERVAKDPVKEFWASDASEVETKPQEKWMKWYPAWIWAGIGFSFISFFLYGNEEDALSAIFSFTQICLVLGGVLMIAPNFSTTQDQRAQPEWTKALVKIANILIAHCAGFSVLTAFRLGAVWIYVSFIHGHG